VAARYYVPVAQELLDDDPPWADLGLKLVERCPMGEPGIRWCLFEDPDAPEELDGKRVELQTTMVGGKPVITDRWVLA
jgi:hypothetical protein